MAHNAPISMPDDQLVASVRRALEVEVRGISGLLAQIQPDQLTQAIRRIAGLKGRLVVMGMGKSGHVGKKLAATFASTGTPAFFVHPAEAHHGDLGMIQAEDLVLALSYSGETQELCEVLPHVKRLGAGLIAITGVPTSTLGRLSDLVLNASVPEEACPNNLAPTASTTAALALGDALAVAVLQLKGFGAEDFARSHPGGSLGRRLLIRVSDLMKTGDQLPRVGLQARLTEVLQEMSAKRMGMTCVVDEQGRAQGIFTDGDLRRLLQAGKLQAQTAILEVMTRQPGAISAEALASEAARIMEERHINHLLVQDASGLLLGAIGIHELLEAQVV